MLRNAIPQRVPSKTRLKNIWFGTGVKRKKLGIYKEQPQVQVAYKPVDVESKQVELPFKIHRAGPGGQLPIYMDYRKGRKQIVTILRKYTGDEQALAHDLKAVCGMADVEVRAGKMIVIGRHSQNIRTWLEKLGF